MPKVEVNSWFVAAILAVGTVATFDRLLDYGPASALRRFHVAIVADNPIELERVTKEPLSDPSLHQLERIVVRNYQAGAKFEVARMDLSQSQVRAAVLYRVGNQMPVPMVFVLDREGTSWKVNATRTLATQQEIFRSRG